jgi:2-polyprenyl-3-methyl-5-hydroxy-6-metoxy-1,4-benzoquinol methylase
MSNFDPNHLGYETFKHLAKDPSVNQHERVGFPAWYREGKVDLIFEDILRKCSHLNREKMRILDIGPGWSDLTKKFLDHCSQQHHEVVLIDCQEMIDLIPSYPNVTKIAAKFPEELNNIENLGEFDVILTYSVIQYPFVETSLFKFIDSAVTLLKREGQFLAGDIPNISMKKRFLASETAKIYHEKFYAQDGNLFPEPIFNQLESDQIDDGVLMGLLVRLRMSGFHAFLLPQQAELPMANRREDLLVVRP